MGTTIPKPLADWASAFNIGKKIKEWAEGLATEVGHFSYETQTLTSWNGHEIVEETLTERLNWHLDEEEKTFRALIQEAFARCRSEGDVDIVFRKYRVFLSEQESRAKGIDARFSPEVAFARLQEWETQLNDYARAVRNNLSSSPKKRRAVSDGDRRRRNYSSEQRREAILLWEELKSQYPNTGPSQRYNLFQERHDNRMNQVNITFYETPSRRAIIVWSGESHYR